MIRDSLVLVLFLLKSSLLLDESLGVCLSGLFHEQVDLLSLGLMGNLVLLAHFLDIGLQFDLLLVPQFLLLHAHDSPFLDLVNDDLGTLLSSKLFAHQALFFLLENLEPLNLHHEVQFLLFLDEFSFQAFILIKLLISDRYYFRVKDHLVHLLNIVQLIVHFLLGLRQQGLILGRLVLLLISWLHFLSSLFIHLDHFLLLGLGFGQGSSFLLVHELLFLQELVLGFDSRCVPDSIQVVLADDYGVVLVVLLRFPSDGAELVHSNESRGSLDPSWVFGGSLGALGASCRSSSG